MFGHVQLEKSQCLLWQPFSIVNKMSREIKIDEIDAEILKALQIDARTPLKDIAKECGLSSVAISKRIEKLKHKGIIIGSSLFISPIVEFKYGANFGINVDYNQEEQVFDFIKKQPNVMAVDQTIGTYDICVYLFVKSIDELDTIAQSIRKQKGVKKVTMHIWINKPIIKHENIEF